MQNKKYTPVRFSHLTSYAGVGAIVRNASDMLMAVVDTRYWNDKDGNISANCIPNVTRIIQSLEIDKDLRMPPTAKVLENGRLAGSYLPAVLFPTYAVCKKCGLLHREPWSKSDIYSAKILKCADEKVCDGTLEQVTWCAVSREGNLDDVPWHYLCHREGDKGCKEDRTENYLRLTTNNKGHKIIQCKKCGSQGRYDKVRGDNGIENIYREQPWIKKQPNNEKNTVEILEINDPGVYLPERVNALVIPPESRNGKSTCLDILSNNSKLYREIQSIKLPLRKKAKIQAVAKEYRWSIGEVEEALNKISPSQVEDRCPQAKFDFVIGDLLEDEYKAFLKPIDDVKDDEDFVTTHRTTQWHELKNKHKKELLSAIRLVDQLVIANRLREIQIFQGFSRIPSDESKNKVIVPPDIVGKSNWLPAIELFGEGLFFTLDEGILSQWERISGVRTRANEIIVRYGSSEENLTQHNTPISPRFLLLHTLSHLLIRELEKTAGYPAASLKERIYSSISAKMSGILIYTAVPDIVGSLGGIIESSEPDAFIALLDGALKHAQWCSLDPVCSEHEGQGPGWLNRAACHACVLVPEPSCEYKNVFLDRTFIKGSEEAGIPNLLEYVGGVK